MWYLPFFAGALLVTWIVSRLARRVLFNKATGSQRALGPNVVALVLATLLGGLGLADGGPPQFVTALVQYLPPVLLLAAIDMVALRRTAPPTPEPNDE